MQPPLIDRSKRRIRLGISPSTVSLADIAGLIRPARRARVRAWDLFSRRNYAELVSEGSFQFALLRMRSNLD